MKKSAVISECGEYRHRLDREVQATGIVIAYYGVNPSTADGEDEDATTGKWFGFSLRNNARAYIAGNAHDYRATDVRKLAQVAKPISDQNDFYLRQIIAEADILVPCWGSRDKLPKELHTNLYKLKCMLFESGKPVKIFGLTKSGDPKHPLMLGYATPLVDWVL